MCERSSSSAARRRAGAALALLLTCGAGAAAADDAPGETRPVAPADPSWGPVKEITLDEAWSLAKEGSPDLEVARHRLAQALLIRRRVAAGLQPFINLGASYTRNSTEATLNLGPLITSYTDYQLYANGLYPAPLPESCADPNDEACAGLVALGEVLSEEIVIQPEDAYGWSASAVWQVGNARSISQGKLASAAVGAATYGTEWAERELMFGVAQAYYGIFSLQQLVGIAEEQVASRERHLELAKARFAAGQVAAVEVNRAEVDCMRARRQLVDTRESLHEGAAELAVLLGSPGVELRVAAPPHPDEVTGGDEVVEAALSSRPDVQAARKQVTVAHAKLLDARLALLPTVALNANYRWSNAAGFTGENGVWAAGATASLALWDGGLRLADAAEARHEIAVAEANLNKLEMGVRKDVEVARSRLSQSQVAWETSRDELALAKRTYEQVVALYEAGMATALELRDAEQLVTSSEVAELRAAMAVDLNRMAVQRAAGEFNPTQAG